MLRERVYKIIRHNFS